MSRDLRLEIDEVTWKGQSGCTAIGTVTPADTSVGIMSPGFECIELYDADGNPVALSDEEEQQLAEQLYPQVEQYYYGRESDWSY